MSKAYLVAGGTGGHINAAIAIGDALTNKDFEIEFITGKRDLDYKLLGHLNTTHIDSRPLRTNNPIKLFSSILDNMKSFLKLYKTFSKTKPMFVVGAGGYVCGPTLLAAYLQGIKIYIIEQNAVMGLTNKILSKIATKIFVHFPKTKGLTGSNEKKSVVVGNPTRSSIRPVAIKLPGESLNVLVFGGSLGAKQINDVIVEIAKKPPFKNLSIVHQTGSNDAQVISDISYKSSKYIDDMQSMYEWSDVIVARAGASTVSELAIIKKPSLLFPYPQATDNHQYFNATHFKDNSDFSVEVLEPNISKDDAVLRVEEFLVKAKNKELNYTQNVSQGNNTCDAILREIFQDVGLA